jgi:hypothetical protein
LGPVAATRQPPPHTKIPSHPSFSLSFFYFVFVPLLQAMYLIGYLASLSVLYVLKLSDALISAMVREKQLLERS